MSKEAQDDNKLIAELRDKLARLREEGRAFPNDFRRNVMAGELHAEYDGKPREFFEENEIRVAIAGRMMSKRVMGKASFAGLQDMSGRIQVYAQRDGLPEGVYQQFKTWDVGDILGVKVFCLKQKKMN
jgi:lysyl-tRNA synthetase class 2